MVASWLMGLRVLVLVVLVGCKGSGVSGSPPPDAAPHAASSSVATSSPTPSASVSAVADATSPTSAGGSGSSLQPPVRSPTVTRPNVSDVWDGSRASIYQSKTRATFSATTVVGQVQDGARHVSGLHTGFRSCFRQEVERDPESQGTLAVSIVLKGDGNVSRIDAQPAGHLSAALVACCRRATLVVPYSPPDDHQGATLSFVVTFYLRASAP